MSIIIKSNNASTSNFGSIKLINTTAVGEFDKYKARVLADGGVIKDEARTLSAFELLFASRMYGSMNTAVSGTFGVKLNGVGKIEKLYAIDGHDLVGLSVGGGALPALDVNNNISFASNATSGAMGILTTEKQHVMSKRGSFGYAIRVVSAPNSVTARRVAGLTKHKDTTNTATYSQIASSFFNGDDRVTFTSQLNPLNLLTNNDAQAILMATSLVSPRMISYITDTNRGIQEGYASGTYNIRRDFTTFKEISSETFYIDLGGTYHSNVASGTQGVVRDFFCFNDATSNQAAQLSGFGA